MNERYRRARRTILWSTLVGAILMATHLGEFWPYSIFPMFSRAGRPWRNVLVREVADPAAPGLFTTVAVEDLPGIAFPVAGHGIPQRDLAKLVREESDWQGDSPAKLRGMLEPFADRSWLLVVRVVGPMPEAGRVITEATPFLLLGPDGAVRHNPETTP